MSESRCETCFSARGFVRITNHFLSSILRQIAVLRLPPTDRACGQVGDLKHFRPNVCRYKLLMFNYLQMFKRFPSAETKVQKNYQCSITSVSPHLPQTHVGGRLFCRCQYNSFALSGVFKLIQNICTGSGLSVVPFLFSSWLANTYIMSFFESYCERITE